MAQQTPSQKTTTTKKQTTAAKTAMQGAMGKQQTEQSVAQEERHDMIAQAAYSIAEQRDFEGDMALDDWLQAEAEVNARFEAKH